MTEQIKGVKNLVQPLPPSLIPFFSKVSLALTLPPFSLNPFLSQSLPISAPPLSSSFSSHVGLELSSQLCDPSHRQLGRHWREPGPRRAIPRHASVRLLVFLFACVCASSAARLRTCPRTLSGSDWMTGRPANSRRRCHPKHRAVPTDSSRLLRWASKLILCHLRDVDGAMTKFPMDDLRHESLAVNAERKCLNSCDQHA